MVLHHCDNRFCFNIDHLYIGTAKDNTRDRLTRNPESIPRGEQLHQKLRDQDVLDIRRLHEEGMSGAAIHRDWYPHISESTIHAVIRRAIWRHI